MTTPPTPPTQPTQLPIVTQQQYVDDAPSLDVVHEQVEWALDQVYEQANGIDAKSGVVLLASSLLFAGVTALQAAIGSHVAALRPGTPMPWWEIAARWIAGGVAITFLAVLGLSLAAMWPRKFAMAPKPKKLRKKYLGKPERVTKAIVMNARVDIYNPTVRKVELKSLLMVLSFFAVAIEGILLVVILMIVAFAL